MSDSTPPAPVPNLATTRAVDASTTLTALATAAEANPVVKADLQAQFDSYSHNPLVAGLTSIVGMMLTRQNITVDNTLLTVGVGLLVTAAGYAWQWISMKMKKPVTP